MKSVCKVWLMLAVMVAAVGLGSRVMGQGSPPPGEDKQLATLVKTLDAQPEEVFSLADKLKAQPYGPDSMAILSVLTKYGMASTKVELRLGSMVRPLATPKHEELELRLFGQYISGLIVYALEHEGKAGDSEPSITFATLDMLTAYHTMLAQRPQAHNAYADKLIGLKHTGQLATAVRESLAVDQAEAAAAKASPSPQPATSETASPSAAPTEPSPAPSETPSTKGTGQL